MKYQIKENFFRGNQITIPRRRLLRPNIFIKNARFSKTEDVLDLYKLKSRGFKLLIKQRNYYRRHPQFKKYPMHTFNYGLWTFNKSLRILRKIKIRSFRKRKLLRFRRIKIRKNHRKTRKQRILKLKRTLLKYMIFSTTRAKINNELI